MALSTNYKQGRLVGKVAVVTGIGGGIGKGCALMFARQGAKVVGCGRTPATVQATVDEARKEGLEMEGLAPCDVMTEEGNQQLIDFAVKKYGGIDILLTAAGVAAFKPVDQMSFQEWNYTIKGELDVVFLACKAAWPHLIARGGGSIINIGSLNAYLTLEGSAALAHCATKGGVVAMTRQLAAEGAPHNIRANTISPGLIETPATSGPLATPGFLENVLSKAMIKRLGQPEDIAWCATYLASDESTWVTASDFFVSGGANAL